MIGFNKNGYSDQSLNYRTLIASNSSRSQIAAHVYHVKIKESELIVLLPWL